MSSVRAEGPVNTTVSSGRRRKSVPRGAGTRGPSMAHVGFAGSRHMHPERMPSAKKERTVSLRLFDVDKDTVDNVVGQSGTVKRLMMHGLNLTNVSDELIDKMSMLEKLDLSENNLGDNSIPDSFKKLENLVELNLSTNRFSKIPMSVRKLKNLTRLSFSHNNLDSLKGLDKMKKLQVLMINNNKFTSVFKELTHMRKLEILDCSGNNIREVGLDVRFLKNLRELNISDNKISVLPTDMFHLPHLESLKASQNQISKVPVFNLNPQHCHVISEIDLSGNIINKFPGHLLIMSSKLDLSSNRMKVLDWNKMKKIEMNAKQELIVDDNPLTFPPSDVCEYGLKSMMQYFQETQANIKTYQGIKILVLGAHNSGKTSFVQTLVDGQPRLSQDMYEKSAGIEPSEMTFDKRFEDDNHSTNHSNVPNGVSNHTNHSNQTTRRRSSTQSANSDTQNGNTDNRPLNLAIWDFCGYPFYLFPHYMFFEQPAVAILTFNMFAYKSELFDEMVSSWFDWMIAKTNKLVVLLVGTHADKMKKDAMKRVCNEVKAKLTAHAEKQRQIVQKKIDIITEKPHISQTLSAQLNAYSALLQEKFVVQSEVIVTSAANNTGFETVRASIELLANDKRQFPNVLRVIPTFWADVENYAEEKGNSMVVPMVEYKEFKEEIFERFGMKHLFDSILQYLNETGKILRFESNATKEKDGERETERYVILRPAWFFDVFRAIFRHDLIEKLDIEVEDSFKTIGITQSRYNQLKEEFLAEGILDRDLLKCMFSHLLPLETNKPFYKVVNFLLDTLDLGYLVAKRLLPLETNKPFYKVVNFLLDTLDLGYLVAKRPLDSGYDLDPEKENMNSRKYLIPWFRKVEQPEDTKTKWAALERKQRLAGVLRFPKYLPPGLFEMLSVRAHRSEKGNLRFLSHWEDGFHARHRTETLQVMFSHSKTHDDISVVRFELRDDNTDQHKDSVPASTMWSILKPILDDFEDLLKSYTGVLVERLMECPKCKELSFLGEWLTPKETQGLQTKPCEECMEEIDTAFLVQPKEKKRDDVRLKLAQMRSTRRRAVELEGQPVTKAPVRQGRRQAVMPMDQLMFSRNATISEQDDDNNDGSAPSSPVGLPGLKPGMFASALPPFLTGIEPGDDEDENDDDSPPSSPVGLPGLRPGMFASLLSEIEPAGDDDDEGSEAGDSDRMQNSYRRPTSGPVTSSPKPTDHQSTRDTPRLNDQGTVDTPPDHQSTRDTPRLNDQGTVDTPPDHQSTRDTPPDHQSTGDTPRFNDQRTVDTPRLNGDGQEIKGDISSPSPEH